MSEMTPCNYCSYQRIRRREQQAGRQVERRAEDGGVALYSDGKRLGVWFMELPETCCC